MRLHTIAFKAGYEAYYTMPNNIIRAQLINPYVVDEVAAADWEHGVSLAQDDFMAAQEECYGESSI